MSLPRVSAAALLLIALHGFLTIAATLAPNVISLSNISTSDAISMFILKNSSNNDEYADCFNPATPRRGLYPAKLEDCLNAAEELISIRNPFRSVTFARRKIVGFPLPKVVRNGTCVISIDVINDADQDIFRPWQVYITARELALRCVQGAFDLGGRTMTGPRKVVDVLVFGRIWPIEDRIGDKESDPIVSEVAALIAGERLTTRDSSLLNSTSINTTEPGVARTSSQDEDLDSRIPELGIILECYDPPLPRERAWPFDFKDCEVATEAIIGDRERNQKYTFSREPVVTKFYYHLPVTLSHNSCVVHLDMNNDSDQDTVRLSIVEATAYVLAHKCSGRENPVEQYGGRTTVGVGSKELIKVWVYGRPCPPPVGGTNVTSLALAQPANLIDSE